jgi:CDP-diacylglycerol--glycerol-3-phosphate 3-phosphatidyltransferase
MSKINIPTKITIARIVLAASLIIFLAITAVIGTPTNWAASRVGDSPIYVVDLVACIVFIVAAATDYLDGHLARKWNMVTDLGKFLDPIADKMLVNSIFIYICVRFDFSARLWTPILPFLVILMVVRDLVVDTMRFVAAKKGIVVSANIFGKAKTVLQMIAIPAVLLNGWPFSYFDASWSPYARIAMILVYICTAASLLSGIIYVKDNAGVFKEDAK